MVDAYQDARQRCNFGNEPWVLVPSCNSMHKGPIWLERVEVVEESKPWIR